MRETASERIVRQAAREVALEAMARIRARLREAEADPAALRWYEAEWSTHRQPWPAAEMPARDWVSLLQEDLEHARAEFEACRRN